MTTQPEDDSAPLVGTRLLDVGSDPSDNTITLVLQVGDDSAMRVDFILGLVGPLLAAIAAEAMKLNALLSEEVKSSTTLNAKAAWLSEDLEGNPMLVFELSSGSLLPLALKSGDFAGLAREMMLLASPAGTAN